jgi:hypothetical protein
MFQSTSILGLSWAAILSDLLSILSIISGPMFLFAVLSFHWKRGDQALPPLMFSAIVLALTSVTLQILAASLAIASGGAGDLTLFFMNARSLLWRVIEFAACILVAAAFQIVRRTPARKAPANDSSVLPISVGATACSAAVLAAGALIWFYGNTVRSQAILFDESRNAEAAAIWARMVGHSVMSIGSLLRLLARPFFFLSLAIATLTFVFIALGVRSLKSGVARRWDISVSGLLTILVLAGCVITAVGMRRDAQYLRRVAFSRDRVAPFAHVRSFPTNGEEALDLLFPRFEIPAHDLVYPSPPPPPLRALTRLSDGDQR